MNWILELTIYILFVICFLFVYFKHNKREVSFLPLLDALSALRMQLTLRSLSVEENNLKTNELYRLIYESYFQGRPIHDSVEIIAKEILKADEFNMEKRRFHSLFVLRICIVLGLSVCARIYLNTYFEMHSKNIAEILAMIFSFILAFVFFFALDHYYPKSWFIVKGLSEEGRDFLNAMFHKGISIRSPIYESWVKIEDQERVSGISLDTTKRLLLETWRSKKETELEMKLRIFEDYVPGAEFVCLGTSSLLILAGPILKMLGF